MNNIDRSTIVDHTPTDAAALAKNNNKNHNPVLWDQEMLLRYAEDQGLELSLTTLGPGFRAVIRNDQNRSQILGYMEGFVRGGGPGPEPGKQNNKLLHIDTMEVFKPIVKAVSASNSRFTGGGNALGIGLLLAYVCVLHGHYDNNCSTVEFLAIDDAPAQHTRLVKLYRMSGFDMVKYVGDDWRDIPDRLVWGGCGTLLRKDIPSLLSFWSRLLYKGQPQRRGNQQR